MILYAPQLESAALQGDVKAVYCAGKLYESGLGVEKDWARSFDTARPVIAPLAMGHEFANVCTKDKECRAA